MQGGYYVIYAEEGEEAGKGEKMALFFWRRRLINSQMVENSKRQNQEGT
jgi:hypothetical protein